MIVDSSAIVAIALTEPGYQSLLDRLGSASHVAIGAPTLAETAIAMSARWRRDARGTLALLLQEFEIEVIPFTTTHFGVAVDAWMKFGKGRHRASLNFGDCLSYAVARIAKRPLLCVGNDFPKTDLELA